MRRTIVVLLVVAGTSACGGGRSVVSIPIDKSKTISDLSLADAQAMCKATIGYASDALNMVCLAQGVTEKFGKGGTEQTCKTAVNSCMAEMQAKIPSCDAITATDNLKTCTATVGEYETCLNDELTLLDKFESKISCSMSQADLLAVSTEMQSMQSLPPSCQVIQQKCPGML